MSEILAALKHATSPLVRPPMDEALLSDPYPAYNELRAKHVFPQHTGG
jgi:hypothetical protein